MDTLPEAAPGGRSGSFLAAGRRLLASVWEHVGLRLELFALELAEERARLVAVLVATAGIVICIAMTIAFAGVAVLVAAWDSPNRTWVAVAVAAVYALVAIGAGLMLRHLLSKASPLFRHSLAEWRRDVDGMRPRIEPEA
jgi:uncharacterized membrane protein YqjE